MEYGIFENFCPPRSYCPIVRGKAKSFLGGQTNIWTIPRTQGYNNDEMLHLKEEGRQLLQSILVTSLISKETCWIALIQTEDIGRVIWVEHQA